MGSTSLSAVAQRNLLQVFESLSPKVNPNLQLIYTTHSPFSIDRNFPTRLRLVRKGDGGEGTQLVRRSASKCYEPVRTALGIEGADTLFFGMTNVILEGLSDQKAIISVSQLSAADSSKAVLDLNKIAFLRGSGVGKVRERIEQARTSDDRRPVVVCLFDGDETGLGMIQQIAEEKLLPKETYSTYSDLKIPVEIEGESTTRSAMVLEELIPLGILRQAVGLYAIRFWGVADDAVEKIRKQIKIKQNKNVATVIVETIKASIAAAKSISKVDIKSEITDIVFDEVVLDERFVEDKATLLANFDKVVKCLKRQIQVADRQSRQENIGQQFRLRIEPFIKLHGRDCTRFHVSNVLRDLSVLEDLENAHYPETTRRLSRIRSQRRQTKQIRGLMGRSSLALGNARTVN